MTNPTTINGTPIVIRFGSANEGDYETRTYYHHTFNEAVAHLQGEHEYDAETGEPGYHRDYNVYVVATYPNTFEEDLGSPGRPRMVARHAGEPVFGYECMVYGRGCRWGSGDRMAYPSWASHTASSTQEARLMLEMYDLATRLAEAANSWPKCEICIQQEEIRAARMDAIRQETEAKAKAHAEFHETVSGVPNGMAAHDGMAAHSHEVRSDHDGVKCACGHGRHQGRVCKECAKITPRGMHGTPARCREAGILKEAR